MRKSFNGLSGLGATHFCNVELLSGYLFLFFNRRRDSVKLLLWDRDGLVIWYKRLEKGTFQVSAFERNGKLSGNRFDSVVATPLGYRLGFGQTSQTLSRDERTFDRKCFCVGRIALAT